MVKIITTMVKTKSSFFPIQITCVIKCAIKFSQTSFCQTPERFDIIDMSFTTGKRVVTMMNSEMFIKADIDHFVVATPFLGMNHGIRC